MCRSWRRHVNILILFLYQESVCPLSPRPFGRVVVAAERVPGNKYMYWASSSAHPPRHYSGQPSNSSVQQLVFQAIRKDHVLAPNQRVVPAIAHAAVSASPRAATACKFFSDAPSPAKGRTDVGDGLADELHAVG